MAALSARRRALAAALAAVAAAATAAEAVSPVGDGDAMPQRPSVEERLEEIRRRLQAVIVYPPIARRLGLEGVTWVQFSIDSRGVPLQVAVARSSGHSVLDRAARHTVDRAGRLPWVYGRIEVPIRFALDEGNGSPAPGP